VSIDTAPRPPAPSGAAIRRTELGAFLRACRARITPEAVGMAPGPRRRTPGLRREEVAQLAGVGVTWYTWLEQGRRINASEQVVEAIARSLKLAPAERDHLYRLAEITPVAQPAGLDIPPEIQSILDALNPLPASLRSARFDQLAWNETYAKLFPTIVRGTDNPRRNSMWCGFAMPECCNPFVNRDVELPIMVAMFRSEYGRHVGEPEWESFVAELSAASPHFAQLWAQQQVAAPASLQKVFRHRAVGEIRMRSTSLSVTSMPEARIVVFTPQDEESGERMEWLRTHPGIPHTDHVH
jgi:transcriptional regulator with XRE-family HTH domain